MDTYTGNNDTSLKIPLRRPITPELIEEVIRALKGVKGWGSIEIYVQDFRVTQITTRRIKKTKHVLAE